MSSSTTTFENFPAVTTTTSSTDCIDEGEFLTKPNTISHSHSQQQEFDAFSNNNTEVEHQQQRQIKTEILNVSSSAYETHFPSLSTSSASSFSKSSSIWVNRSTTSANNNTGSDFTYDVSENNNNSINNNKKSNNNIVTQVLDLPASQQLQKKEFGNKTTTVAIVKRVKEKTNTNIDVSTGQKTGTTTFLIKGKIGDVTRAKFELLDNLAIKKEDSVKVPIFAIYHLKNKQNQVLSTIINKTGVRIYLPSIKSTTENFSTDPNNNNHSNRSNNNGNSNVNIDGNSSNEVEETTVDVRIEGNENGVETAKGELETFVSSLREETIKVPISSLRHIIGSGGMTIQSIRNKSGVRIPNFPRKDAQIEQKSELDYDDEEENIDLKIDGDVNGIEIAKAEIRAIIDTKASKRTHRITHIEQHYYQLIAGAHNQRLKQIATETGARIDIPFSHGSGGISTTSEINATTTDSNSQKNCITIIGDKDAVKKATEIIEEIYDELSSTTCLATIDIPKRQHKIFLSHKGAFLQEVFETTGCFVDVPSMSDPSEKISIRGPQEKFSDVFKLLYDKANSITIKSLDVTKIHKFNNNDGVDNPLEYIKNLYKYFINRNKLKIIESETEVYIAIPQAPSELDKDKILYFEGKVAANVEKAKKDVTELIKNLPPANFTTVNIESHLHRHIIGRKGQNLQRVKETYGVEIIVPDEKEESSNILIVYEGAVGVDGNAIAVDNNDMNDVLVKVKTELKKAGQDASEFSTKTLNIPVRFHRNIIGPRGATLNSITGGIDSPVSVKFGLHRTGAAERSANAEGKRFNNLPVSSDDLVVIKGPTEEVERVVREINKVVQAKNLEEPVNPHTINFTLPAKYLAHIIGKGGLHITRLKESFNVKIDIDVEGGGGGSKSGISSGNDDNNNNNNNNNKNNTNSKDTIKITINGAKDNVEQAKAKILSLVDKLQDPVIETLKIPMEYHKLLIGPKGRYVRKLEEKCNVQIRFPKSKEFVTASNNGSNDDDANNSSNSGSIVDTQKPDEVIIRGKKKGIDEAKAELLELLDYEKENNNSITFTIPAKYLPHIVGRNGSRISEIRDNTSTRIDFEKQEIDNDSSNTDNSEKANIDSNNNSNISKNNVNNQQQQEQKLANVAIYGVKSNINKAKLQILGIVNELENQVIVKIKIDHQYHKYLIGPGGNHIREIVARAGGSDERNLASVVKFPYFGDNSDEVTLKGDKVLVESVKTELERLVEEQKNIPVDYIHIPPSQYSMIIGRNGIQLREFQERFNVEIKIPNYSTRKQQQNYHQYPVYDTNQTGSWSDEIECNDNNIEEAIKITGKAEDIKAAKNEILSRIRYAHTINIPRKFHHALLANGTTFKKLRNDFHVILDHDEVIPTDSIAATTTINNSLKKQLNGSASSMKHNVDDNNNNDNDDGGFVNNFESKKFLEYEIIEIHNDNVTGGGDDSSSKNNIDDSGYVAWKLRGEKGQVEKAEEYIKNLLNQEKQFTHIGYIQIPKEYHSHIIGRGGGTITRIRSESGCRIDVPKSKNDKVVVVTGSQEGVEIARQIMFDVIDRAENSNYY